MKKIFLVLGLVAMAAVSCKDDEGGGNPGDPTAVEELTISDGSVVYVQLGTTNKQFKLTLGAEASGKTLEWTSDKPQILAVDQTTGLLSFGSNATASKISISVSSESGKLAAATVYLVPEAPAGYEVIEETGQITEGKFYMLDRNVGASAVGKSGNYYQWGRKTVVAAEGATSVNDSFNTDIAWNTADADWAEGLCPEGWRLPTKADLEIIKSKTLAYYDYLLCEEYGFPCDYTDQEIEDSIKAWDTMQMAPSGMFNVKDENGDGKITADEVAFYTVGAESFWSSELTETSNSLNIPCAYNFLNNSIPTVEKQYSVMNAMPVRCVMDIK